MGSGPKPRAMYMVPHGSAATNLAVAVPSTHGPEPLDGLSDAERAVWVRWAPLAYAAGFLPPIRELGFAKLCKDIALGNELRRRLDEEGWTFTKVTIDGAGQEHSEQKRHPLWTPLQNTSMRVDQGMKAFGLTSDGRPSGNGGAAANEWSAI